VNQVTACFRVAPRWLPRPRINDGTPVALGAHSSADVPDRTVAIIERGGHPALMGEMGSHCRPALVIPQALARQTMVWTRRLS